MSYQFPDNFNYADTHEYVLEENGLLKIGVSEFAIDQFINQVIPEDIQLKDKSSEILPQGCSEIEALNELEEIANKNTKIRSLIGCLLYTSDAADES